MLTCVLVCFVVGFILDELRPSQMHVVLYLVASFDALEF